jgi:Glycosyl hydrolase catalytic core
MIWGGAKTKELLQDRIDELIQPHVEAGTIHRVLCFNEPDKKNQANMEPDRWRPALQPVVRQSAGEQGGARVHAGRFGVLDARLHGQARGARTPLRLPRSALVRTRYTSTTKMENRS